MDKLAQIFDFNYHGIQVRTLIRNGEPWFVARDVCEILEVDPTQTRRLDEDEKGLCLIQTPGGPQEMQIVNEAGLYSLVLGSRKPEAREFKRWITHEVERRQALEAKIEADKPKVEFYDAVAAAEGLHTMNEAAKLLGLGPHKLFALLRGARILLSSPKNVPRMEFIRRGYFVSREKTIQKGAGEPQEIYCQTYVTGKGLQFLERFVKKHVKQTGFPGHRPGGGKSEKVLRHEYARKASLFGGM